MTIVSEQEAHQLELIVMTQCGMFRCAGCEENKAAEI